MYKLSLSYIAGFFDGEGSISLVSSAYRKTQQHNYWPVLQCTLGQINPFILKLVQKQFGGYLHLDKSNPRGCWKFCISSLAAEKFLKKLLPFLIGKKKEAIAALNYRTTFSKSGRKLTSTEKRIRQKRISEFHKIRGIVRQSTYPN